jgi:hypothetical protein
MLKRLIPALFLLVYTFSVVVGSTIGRAQAWASDRTQNSRHEAGQHSVRINGWHRRAPRQLWQTKIPEDGSFIVSPFVRATPPHFETTLYHFAVGFAAGQTVQVFSSRAPPTAVIS